MDRDEALAALREVAVEVLSVDADAVTEDARFKEDLDADSLDLVELVMGLEERFDISVPEEDLENVGTVGQAVDLVMAKVAAKYLRKDMPAIRPGDTVRVHVKIREGDKERLQVFDRLTSEAGGAVLFLSRGQVSANHRLRREDATADSSGT